MKNRTLRRAAETLVLLLIAAMALLLAAGLHQHEPDGALAALSTGWYQLTDGVRRDVTLPATLPAEPGQTLTLYNDTLTDSDGGKVLSARGVEYDIEIRAGETLLYRYEDNAFPKNAQMKGRLWADAELPDNIGGQTLSLTLTPLSGRTVALAAPVLGTAPAVTGHHIQSSLFSIGMMLAMLVLAVLALLIFFYMSFFGIRELRFLDVAVFLLLCSLWCLTDSGLYQIYGRDTAAGSVVSFYAFMTMPIPMVHFVRNTVSGRLRLVPDVCIALFCANALAQGAAYRLLGVPFIAMLPLTHLLLTAGVAAMLTALLRSYRDKPAPQLRLRIAAFAALGAFGVAALVLYWLLHIYWYDAVYQFGVLLFIILLLYGLIGQAAGDMRFHMEHRISHEMQREDRMTGLPNRRAFEEYMERIRTGRAGCRDAVLTYIRLEGLNERNDRFGLQAGDESVIAAAQCVADFCRACEEAGESVLCFRTGGNEFALIRPEPHTDSGQLHRQFRAVVARYNRTCAPRARIIMTFGFSRLCDEDGKSRSISAWKAEADAHLKKKRSRTGRRRRMTTNIHYLIAAMAVLLVVLWQYSRQRQMDDRNSLMFRRLLRVVSLDVAAELVSTGFILYAPYSFNVCRMLSNTVFYLFQALLPLLLLYYVCTLCTSRVIAPSTVLRMGIPTIALVFVILTNPFTEILFYFDSTGYRHGPWYLLLYVSALLHIAGAAVFVAVHRASVSRRTLTELLAVFALAALGIAAQAVNPSVLTTGFGLSLSILAMYLTINNPCACMDSLTGLNDKQYLLRRMDELTDAHKAFHIITVYAYQLDHINKVAGVQNGDEFLRRAAERMQEIADRNVFRISGKRFLLMTFSLREYETCLTRLRQLFHTQPDDAHAAPTPVILCGVVNAEKLGTSGLVLDYAEYLESLVSRSGETQVIQNDRKTMDSFHYNKQVEQFLHRAIAEDLFEVYYQPVYSLHQQRFVTLEALSRLRHPELGWISPDIFIRLAEKNHLITQITELQLRRVCRFLCENPALRASIANVKINLSPLDLIQSESGSHLVRILGEYGLPCSCFQFEITETVATEYSASLTRVAESLQAAGIGLCLDDFGSGYANLNTVMQLPFSVIKLDRSLLFHICTDKKAALFYQSIVAEGVETQEEMELLRSWNVDMIQGYYFSRPLPPDDLLRLLTESAETPAQDQA